MLTTLRQFGGELTTCPVVAFQGRTGHPISAESLSTLADLNVEYVYDTQLNRAPWFNYSNKIAAVSYAQNTFTTPWNIWLDSDVVFLDAPAFATRADLESADFHARFEYLPPAVSQDDHEFASYWTALCRQSGVEFDDLAYYDLDLPSKRMKPFFNSGVFLWRTASDFAQTYARNYYRLIDARIAPKGIGPWFADQVTLTPTIAALKMNWKLLDVEDHLMMFEGVVDDPTFSDVIARANIVHYSKSRNDPYRARFDPLLVARRPELRALLEKYDTTPPLTRRHPMASARMSARRLRQALYVRRCKSI